MTGLCKTFEFCASHTLYCPEWDLAKNIEVFGKCANPNGHGHNYCLEVIVTGPLHPQTNMIIDANVLKAIVMENVIDDVDHKNLNVDVPWLQGVVPTVEALTRAFWSRIQPLLTTTCSTAKLHRIKLWETRTIYAICEED